MNDDTGLSPDRNSIARGEFRSIRRFENPFDEIEHFAGDIERQLIGLRFLVIARLHATPALFRGHIEEMKLQRKPRVLRELRKFIAMDALAQAEIEHAGHVAAGHLQRGRPDMIHAAFHPGHRPGRLDRLGRIHPEQCRHPFVDGKADTLQSLGQGDGIGGLTRAGRAADEMNQCNQGDKVFWNGAPGRGSGPLGGPDRGYSGGA